MEMKYEVEFETDYNQFFIQDKNSAHDTGSPNFWNPDTYEDRMAVGDQILGVGTETSGGINVELYMLDSQVVDTYNFEHYSHIVEGPIALKSGTLQILNCPDNEVKLEIKLNPGEYRVRVYTALEDNTSDYDLYKIEIWKENLKPSKVLKS